MDNKTVTEDSNWCNQALRAQFGTLEEIDPETDLFSY